MDKEMSLFPVKGHKENSAFLKYNQNAGGFQYETRQFRKA